MDLGGVQGTIERHRIIKYRKMHETCADELASVDGIIFGGPSGSKSRGGVPHGRTGSPHFVAQIGVPVLKADERAREWSAVTLASSLATPTKPTHEMVGGREMNRIPASNLLHAAFASVIE
jgi:hypothetical protein